MKLHGQHARRFGAGQGAGPAGAYKHRAGIASPPVDRYIFRMGVFIVTRVPATADRRPLGEAVETAFPGQNYRLGEHGYLVAAEGTAREVSDKLGLSEGKTQSAMVAAVFDYYGWGDRNLWAWIESRMSRSWNRGATG